MIHSRYNPGLHRIALLLAAMTFPLIFLGGLVTGHHAGMSVPDWPNSYGYNMFLFPPSQWVGGIFYEHTHRLLGTVVGFLSVLLLIRAWGPSRNTDIRRWSGWMAGLTGAVVIASVIILAGLGWTRGRTISPRSAEVTAVVTVAMAAIVLAMIWLAREKDPRALVRWLTVAALGAVLLQGVLGGLRVVLANLDLAIVHGCFAQALFCLTAFIALATSRWWIDAPDRSMGPHAASGRALMRIAMLGVVVVFGQLVVGAVMRHEQAGLAIPDFPLNYGQVLPPTTTLQLEQANQARMRMDLTGQPIVHAPHSLYGRWMGFWSHQRAALTPLTVTLPQIWLHFAHRLGAIIVSCVLLWIALKAMCGKTQGLTRMGILLIVLLLTQVTLGALTVLLGKPADVASAHVAVGALVLMTTFIVAARSARLFSFRRNPVVQEGFESIEPRGERSHNPAASSALTAS